MEGEIIVREKAFIPWVKEFTFEETEEWGQALRDSIPKTLEGILKGVPDNEAFRKKIVKPLIVAVRKMLGNGFVSRQGLTQELILEIMKAKLTGEDAAKNYQDSVKLAYEAFDQGELNSAMVAYHRGKSFGAYRFREAIEKSLGWLTQPFPLNDTHSKNNISDKLSATSIRNEAERAGLTLFIQPAKQGRFRLKFSNQVKHSGKLISNLAFDPQYFKPENDKINALINQYISKDIVPFITNGKSHCDFVLIPESVVPANSAKAKEKKYEIYKHFYGEEHANKLRAVWIVMDESIPPNPDDYIGNPNKLAYFDMELDVQVARKK